MDNTNVICTIKHHSGKEMAVTPGTYVYAGFGTGTLYLSEEQQESCTTLEAKERCDEAELEYRRIDPLSGYTGTYLGD